MQVQATQLGFDRDPLQRPRKLRDLPAADRPLHRLREGGASYLASAELLELVTGTDVAIGRDLLARFDGLRGLARASLAELEEVPSLGPARAARIKAAFELGQRLSTEHIEERPTVHSPGDAANLLMAEMSLLEQEHLRVVLLDTRNRALGTPTVYVGNLSMTMIRTCEVFREAIRQNCAAIIVAHNHPSHDPTPSPEDIAVTRHLVSAGKLLDIEVLDHLVIGHHLYVSLKERGLGFD
jgi:DNA repair protein RadC